MSDRIASSIRLKPLHSGEPSRKLRAAASAGHSDQSAGDKARTARVFPLTATNADQPPSGEEHSDSPHLYTTFRDPDRGFQQRLWVGRQIPSSHTHKLNALWPI